MAFIKEDLFITERYVEEMKGENIFSAKNGGNWSGQSALNNMDVGTQAKIRKLSSVLERSCGESRCQFLKFEL